ncbi:hypothetical protein ACFLRI_00580 [Bacteroidota bacterium]
MKTNYLFPNQLKKVGWILFLLGVITGLIFMIFKPDLHFLDINIFAIVYKPFLGDAIYFCLAETDISDEIICLLIIIGGLFVAFSKEKTEDEFISKIRLESLLWSTYVNFAILIISILFTYEEVFFWIIVFNMFTILIFFIIRFNWALYKSRNQIRDEE